MREKKGKSCLLILGLVIFLPFLAYYSIRGSYCQGWWGQQNLFLRSQWLCFCSPAFEQSLYPEHVEVMFSACDGVRVWPVADGRYVQIWRDNGSSYGNIQMLDTHTNNIFPYEPPIETGFRAHFGQELVLLRRYSNSRERQNWEYFAWNWKNGHTTPLKQLSETTLSPHLPDGSINPDVLTLFETGEHIFLSSTTTQAIVLTSNWWQNPEESFIILEDETSEAGVGWLKEAVTLSSTPYTKAVHTSWDPREILSPDGQYIATVAGIYAAESNEHIVPAFQLPNTSIQDCDLCYYPCCWLPAENAVLYTFRNYSSSSFYPTQYQLGAPSSDSRGFWMPVLKVNLPTD